MRVNIYPVSSSLHEQNHLEFETEKLLNDLNKYGDFDFSFPGIDGLYQGDLAIILIQSGGSEGTFLKVLDKLQSPFYLLTFGNNNSLAASMEILSYLKAHGERAEILHGNPDFLAKRMIELSEYEQENPVNLGVIGKPSDWLIASGVDKEVCLKKLNVNLKDIEIGELLNVYKEIVPEKDYENYKYDHDELKGALKVYHALERVIDIHDLQGFTIRCFDLLSSIRTTACLGLSLFNEKGVVGSCEGDEASMLSMYILNKVIGQTGFQANPSRVDISKNEIVFAHCTLPLNMANGYELTTHYESDMGVAIKGKMKEGKVTVFKLSNDLRHYYLEEGEIIGNLSEKNLCRTQILIKLDDVRYFLTSPYGNHHIIVYGSHKNTIKNYLSDIL